MYSEERHLPPLAFAISCISSMVDLSGNTKILYPSRNISLVALNAYQMVTNFEKLNPSLEPCHAFAEAIKIAPKLSKDTIIIVNSCGDAKKDRDILKARLGSVR